MPVIRSEELQLRDANRPTEALEQLLKATDRLMRAAARVHIEIDRRCDGIAAPRHGTEVLP